MRTVSFVKHLEFEYQGNLFSKAVTLGDVDNDQTNELIVGNVHGDLYIFKGSESKPWLRCQDLGSIACVGVGDVCNHGMNCAVTLSVEGWCHVIVVDSEASKGGVDPSEESVSRILKPKHRQQFTANSKCILIADVDGDGMLELVIGYFDRRVRCYRWTETGDTLPSSPGNLTGTFKIVEQWTLAGQIGSITVNKRDGKSELMVSQPGGTFVTLLGKYSKLSSHNQDGDPKEMPVEEPSLLYHPLGSARSRNPGVTTEVVGSISRRKKGEETKVPHYSAICTLDGTLTLVDDDKILWSLYVDHQLFSLNKLDITGDGTEEVVACSWDGQTYMVNLTKEVVRFQFREDVAAFCAGYYAVDKGHQTPCLIYCTFNNKILVYYGIDLPQIGNSDLVHKLEGKEGITELQNYFNCDESRPQQIKQLYHWCLYGFHPKTS